MSFVAELEPQDPTTCSDDAWGHEGLDSCGGVSQTKARKVVKGIAKLKVSRTEFDRQAAALQATNAVYKHAEYDADLVAQWCPDANTPEVPPIIVDSVVAVPTEEEDPGRVVASGPGDATAAGALEQQDADVEAAKQARYVNAFSAEDIPGAGDTAASMEVAALMQQLEELDNAAQRSVAEEVESAMEGGACLVDNAGRERILQICGQIRDGAARISRTDRLHKLQAELQSAAMGKQAWQAPDPEPGTMPKLDVPRGATPLSLWDWKVWSQAGPAK